MTDLVLTILVFIVWPWTTNKIETYHSQYYSCPIYCSTSHQHILQETLLKKEIRRQINKRTAFQCEICSTVVKAGPEFEWRPQQYVSDHTPEIKRCCSKCIYNEAFGSKGRLKRKRNKQVETESHLYEHID